MSERRDREIGDRLIDEVARQMTDAQPPVDFRARVLARIAEGHSPRAAWHAAWGLAPLAAAVVLLVAIFLARSVRLHEPQPRQSADHAIVTNPDTTTVRETAAATASTVKKPSPKNGFGGTRKADSTESISEIDALAPSRLEVAALDVEALPTSSISVPQLDVIAPITVNPLPPDDARPVVNEPRPPTNDQRL
jgi:hypothetical protein